ncbi:MAG: hypothetical protein ACPG5P_07095 [Saprospiraceae bacterium]
MTQNLRYFLFPILILSLSFSIVQAQGEFDNEELLGIVYNDEMTVDLRFHTNGLLSLALNRGKIKTYYRTTFYQVEIGYLKHPKESRNNDLGVFNGQSAKPYSFGKQNSLFMLRGGWGEKRYFSEKAEQKGLAIGMSYTIGGGLGILKPYYLDLVIDDDSGNFGLVRTGYSEEIRNTFLDVNSILGASGFGAGWKGLSVMPGIHAKLGVHLDWGAFDEIAKGLEFGFMIDAFYKKVPIMVSEKNTPIFLNVYLALQLGKRW